MEIELANKIRGLANSNPSWYGNFFREFPEAFELGTITVTKNSDYCHRHTLFKGDAENNFGFFDDTVVTFESSNIKSDQESPRGYIHMELPGVDNYESLCKIGYLFAGQIAIKSTNHRQLMAAYTYENFFGDKRYEVTLIDKSQCGLTSDERDANCIKVPDYQTTISPQDGVISYWHQPRTTVQFILYQANVRVNPGLSGKPNFKELGKSEN